MSVSLDTLMARYVQFLGPRISPGTRATIKHRVSQWSRFMCDDAITLAAIEEFRNRSLECRLSPRTIESTVAVVRQIVQHAGAAIDLGRRLKRPRPNPVVPSLAQIESLYGQSSVAHWPSRIRASHRVRWWQCFIVLAGWSALRLEDLARLNRRDVCGSELILSASKTERFGRPSLCLPIPGFLRRHLDECPTMAPDRLLGLTTCYRQLRQGLQSIALAAGVPYVSPQGFRRYAVNQWSSVDSYAAAVLQGQALGSLGHYLDVGRLLSSVSPRVPVPLSWLSDEERSERASGEQRLLCAYRLARPDSQALLLDLAERVR